MDVGYSGVKGHQENGKWRMHTRVIKHFRVLNDPMILGCFRLIYSNLIIDWG